MSRGRGRGDAGDFDDLAPVDLAAVRRDDELIEAISGDGYVTTESQEEYELASMLAGWRSRVLADPMPAGPDLDEVVAAVHREIAARDAGDSARARASARWLGPVGAAAALVLVAVGGVSAMSYGAAPGDALWSIKQVVFSEQAQSTEASQSATADLEKAEYLLEAGDPAGAQQLIDSAQGLAGAVRDNAQRSKLDEWLGRLSAQVETAPAPPPVTVPDPSVQSDPGFPVLPPPPPVQQSQTSASATPPPPTSPPPTSIPPSSQAVVPPVESTTPSPTTTTPSATSMEGPTTADESTPGA